jgi:hypothetical protein
MRDRFPAARALPGHRADPRPPRPLAENLEIRAGNRGCLWYELGRGGASNAIFNYIDCESPDTVTNNGVFMNSSNTQLILHGWNFGCGPNPCARIAVNLQKGALIFSDSNIEGNRTAVFMNNANGDISTIMNLTVGSPCGAGGSAIATSAADIPGTALFQNIFSPGCALLINGHPGGSGLSTGAIVVPRVFDP